MQANRKLCTALLACTCTLAAAFSAMADSARTVKVTVRGADGAPVPGAQVLVREDLAMRTEYKADENGVVELALNSSKLQAVVKAENIETTIQMMVPEGVDAVTATVGKVDFATVVADGAQTGLLSGATTGAKAEQATVGRLTSTSATAEKAAKAGTFRSAAAQTPAQDGGIAGPGGVLCTQGAGNCQAFDTVDANTSNVINFICADDFNPATSGNVTDICWWGAYLPANPGIDAFRVCYYNDAGGAPGALIACFTQGVDLTVGGPVDTGQLVAGIAPIFEFTGTHAAVAVTAGQCYWIEITNDQGIIGATWFWEQSFGGNLRAIQSGGILANDLSFCVNVGLGDPSICLPPPPTNDSCATPEAIAGEGTFAFDNSAATTDGLPHASCLAFGLDQIENDVWFCWTAPCTSLVRIETCGLTGVDTRIAVYDGCLVCPPTDLEKLACNDDSCGLQSRVSFNAVAGQTYMIRIGTFPGSSGGLGQFSIACVVVVDLCMQPPGNCQDFSDVDANTSNVINFICADDFNPATSGNVTDICWWGAYLPANPGIDAFRVCYYNDAGGAPGALIACFTQGVDLTVGGPVDTGQLVAGIAPIFEFTGTHAAVAVTAGQCYWIEITNDQGIIGATWFWEQSFGGNLRALQSGNILLNDLSFCVNVGLGDPAICLPPPPANDSCSTPEPITGEGNFAFDNSAATTDGLPHASCLAFGLDQIESDVWFCWTATCSTTVRIETCGLTGVDTRIAVYNGCGVCPPTDLEKLACNDDSCGLQSRVSFTAVAGQQYLIRLGVFPGSTGGIGQFNITCVNIVNLCTQPVGNCQDYITADANTSDVLNFICADDFNPATSGNVTDICWWGAYLPNNPGIDSFRVCYYADAGGAPGALLCCFTQGVDLVVAGPADTGDLVAGIAPIYEYTGTHPPCAVTAGQCYWIEITNDAGIIGATWFWEQSLSGNLRAIQSGTILANDLAFCVNVGLGDPNGCLPPPPANDDCVNAEPLVGPFPILASGSTAAATADPEAIFCGTSVTTGGVWYTVVGTGNTMTATTCDGTDPNANATYDTKISVYCGDCAALTCVAGNDDNCPTGTNGLFTTISWCSQAGATYRIFVHGFGAATGSFNMVILDDGTPCGGAVNCLPTGACCLPDDSCVVTTGVGCATLGGDYAGDGVPCATFIGGQEYSSGIVNVAIPDSPGGPVSSTLIVPDSNPIDLNEIQIGVLIPHTWQGDLVATVTSPLGTTVTIIDRPGFPTFGAGFSADNFGNPISGEKFIVSMDAVQGPYSDPAVAGPGIANVTGKWLPENGNLNDWVGQDKAGTWTLTVQDFAGADVGTIVEWCVIKKGATIPTCPLCAGERGDTNCDGNVDFFDIDPFLQALFDLPGYLATYCGGDICAADIDCSGQVDFFDIDPFLDCLFSSCPPCP